MESGAEQAQQHKAHGQHEEEEGQLSTSNAAPASASAGPPSAAPAEASPSPRPLCNAERLQLLLRRRAAQASSSTGALSGVPAEQLLQLRGLATALRLAHGAPPPMFSTTVPKMRGVKEGDLPPAIAAASGAGPSGIKKDQEPSLPHAKKTARSNFEGRSKKKIRACYRDPPFARCQLCKLRVVTHYLRCCCLAVCEACLPCCGCTKQEHLKVPPVKLSGSGLGLPVKIPKLPSVLMRDADVVRYTFAHIDEVADPDEDFLNAEVHSYASGTCSEPTLRCIMPVVLERQRFYASNE